MYEELDYLLVPTYFPVLMLLVRAEGLLLLYEVFRGIMSSTQTLNIILAAFVYIDFIVVSERKHFDMYIGGVLPTALALVTNGVFVTKHSTASTTHDHNSLNLSDSELWHIVVDAVWSLSCLFAVYVALLRGSLASKATQLCYFCLFVASLCIILHVVMLDGIYSTTLVMMMCRVVVFYVLALFVYAIRARRAMHPIAHRHCTLHVSLPALFLHIYVLPIYIVLLLMIGVGVGRTCMLPNQHKLHEIALQKTIMKERSEYSTRDKSEDKNREEVNGCSMLPNNNTNCRPIEQQQQETDDYFLMELRQAKMHITTGRGLGFV